MTIRKAEEKDLFQTLVIYNYEVLNGTATLDLTRKSLGEWKIWLTNHNQKNHPLLVCEIDDKIAGYASLSPYRTKEAYKSTVELSVYVSKDFRRQGIASKLIEELISIAKNDGITHTIVSVITSGNEASQKLHEKFGFEFCGKIKAVGTKFGKFLDIENYQLILSWCL